MERLQLKDYFTIANALFGFLAIALVALGALDYFGGVVFVLLAVLMDFLDGKVARLTLSSNELGKQLDSLADMVSFGVAPAFLVLSLVARPVVFGPSFASLALLGAVVYVACGLVRLARFNLQKEKGVFYGLPIPVAAVVLLLPAPFAGQYSFVLLLVLGGAMVSGFKLKKVG